jgi:hypothetical protein
MKTISARLVADVSTCHYLVFNIHFSGACTISDIQALLVALVRIITCFEAHSNMTIGPSAMVKWRCPVVFANRFVFGLRFACAANQRITHFGIEAPAAAIPACGATSDIGALS